MPQTREEEFVESVSIGRVRTRGGNGARAVPAARALAKRLNVDLAAIEGSGRAGLITLEDVLASVNPSSLLRDPAAVDGAPQSLRGMRRAMAHSMSLSRDQVSGSTVCDDADIHSWTRQGDYMLRLMRAMICAWRVEPALNAWYDSSNLSRTLFAHIDLAIAVDTPGGLIVPVVRRIESKTPEQLRAAVIAQKEAALQRRTPSEDLRDFTLMLSNFGTLAGRYGIPIVVPPAVAILGAGKVREDAVAVAVDVRAGRHAEAHEGGDNIVAVLFVAGEQPVLHQERPIAEAVGVARLVALLESRYPDDDFSVLERDKLDSLAGAEVVSREPVAHRLEELVVPHLFLEPWGDGHQRRDPVRLFALNLGDARKPVDEVVLDIRPEVRKALCMARCRKQKNNRNHTQPDGSQMSRHHPSSRKVVSYMSGDPCSSVRR